MLVGEGFRQAFAPCDQACELAYDLRLPDLRLTDEDRATSLVAEEDLEQLLDLCLTLQPLSRAQLLGSDMLHEINTKLSEGELIHIHTRLFTSTSS